VGGAKRVAIARAQVTKPDLLLADEPTGNLDSASTTEVLDLLRRFNEENGQTIVIVTHDAVVGNACGRVLTMLDGVIADAPAA
jgi:ABC-type lipoprotein export system ATPase subunit